MRAITKTQVESFVKISGISFAKYKNDAVYKFLVSPHHGIVLDNLEAAQFMKHEYNDDFYIEMLRLENEARIRETKRIKNKELNGK